MEVERQSLHGSPFASAPAPTSRHDVRGPEWEGPEDIRQVGVGRPLEPAVRVHVPPLRRRVSERLGDDVLHEKWPEPAVTEVKRFWGVASRRVSRPRPRTAVGQGEIMRRPRLGPLPEPRRGPLGTPAVTSSAGRSIP